MRTVARTRFLAVALTIGLVLGSLLMAGCQSQQKTTKMGRPCPVCGKQTRIMPLTDLKYTTCVCPACKKVTTLDVATQAAVEAYTGRGVGDTVEVCDNCQVIVERCAACREKQGK
jgi:uncharacterized lipoprotein YajG